MRQYSDASLAATARGFSDVRDNSQPFNPLGTNYGTGVIPEDDNCLKYDYVDFPRGLGAALRAERQRRGLTGKQVEALTGVKCAVLHTAERQPKKMNAEPLETILELAELWEITV